MGVFNTAIIENDGTRWGDGVFALEADSQEDAEALAAHIVSDDIVLEVQIMLEAKGVYSATGEMISKLPAHK